MCSTWVSTSLLRIATATSNNLHTVRTREPYHEWPSEGRGPIKCRFKIVDLLNWKLCFYGVRAAEAKQHQTGVDFLWERNKMRHVFKSMFIIFHSYFLTLHRNMRYLHNKLPLFPLWRIDMSRMDRTSYLSLTLKVIAADISDISDSASEVSEILLGTILSRFALGTILFGITLSGMILFGNILPGTILSGTILSGIILSYTLPYMLFSPIPGHHIYSFWHRLSWQWFCSIRSAPESATQSVDPLVSQHMIPALNNIMSPTHWSHQLLCTCLVTP